MLKLRFFFINFILPVRFAGKICVQQGLKKGQLERVCLNFKIIALFIDLGIFIFLCSILNFRSNLETANFGVP